MLKYNTANKENKKKSESINGIRKTYILMDCFSG
jgi:hypothetical protein